MKRDGRVEILRCLFMFGICLLHSITQGGHLSRWIDNLMMPCVTGFVVISAWFGVSFKPSKVLRLIGIAAWCSVAVAFYFRVNIVLECFQGYWFLWSYVLMMLFAPIIDNARLSLNVVLPSLIGVFAWGFCSELPFGNMLLPHTAGLTAYSGITFIGVYIAVRTFRQNGLENMLTTRQWGLVAGLSAVFCECGLKKYNSPFSLTMTLSLLMLVLRMPRMPCLESVALLVAPSMFAVYLYHTGAGFAVLRSVETYLADDLGVCVYATHVVAALFIFFSCVIIDVPRRILCRLVRRSAQKCLESIDVAYSRIVVRVKVKIGSLCAE